MGQTELKPAVHSSPSNQSSSQSDMQGTSASEGSSVGSSSAGICAASTEVAVRAAIDQKALDVKAIDVSKHCSFADNFLIVSGTSERHSIGIATRIVERLKKAGHMPLSLNGMDRGEWIVLDFDDLIIHVFFEPSRQFYELDVVWENSPFVTLPKELQDEIRFLRTGSFP